MRLLIAVAVLSAVFGMSGCYDFESPLDASPQLPVDPGLIGEWRCLSENQMPDEEVGIIVFVPSGERTYDITIKGGESIGPYQAYASRVADSTMLNVDISDSKNEKKWFYLVRYAFLLPNVLRLELVNNALFRGQDHSSAELRAAFERKADDPGMFENPCICSRVKRQYTKMRGRPTLNFSSFSLAYEDLNKG